MRILLTFALVLGAVACGGDDDEEQDQPDTFSAQVQRGQALYGENCARCHGADGSGTMNAPRLVGEGRLPLDPPATAQGRTAQFRTAADVFTFTSATMPGDAPGSLSTENYLDILAFALSANGVELMAPLTASSAPSVTINP